MLQMHYDAKAGHLGGNLSCIGFLMYLYHCKIKDSDEFLLSKGHSAGALYTALWSLGLINDDDLNSFPKIAEYSSCSPSGPGILAFFFLQVHLDTVHRYVLDLPYQKKWKKEGNIYCLCSDGEWQEGSCWEALIFSIHHKLDNFVLIVDEMDFKGLVKLVILYPAKIYLKE